MGLDFKRWLAEKLRIGEQPLAAGEVCTEGFCDTGFEWYVRKLAFWSCVDLIAKAVSKCEFRTFAGGKEVKKREYYTWNFEPNKNQNSSAFLRKLIFTLYRDNEAIVIDRNGQLLVADGFSRKPYTLYEDLFTQVQVGEFTFAKTFEQSELLYFKLYEERLRPVIDGMTGTYQKLLDYGMKSYQRSRGSKGILTIDTMAAGGDGWKSEYERLKNLEFKSFHDAESAVLPLYKGFQYNELGAKAYANENTRDIRAMVDDLFDFTARPLGIPPVLMSGKVEGTKDALDQLLTFCIDPLADMLSEEINRKRYGYNGFSAGDFLQIDTRAVKHIDLLGVAEPVDKLIASGAYCINEIRRLTGDQEIDEDWARIHYITKNYEQVQTMHGMGG